MKAKFERMQGVLRKNKTSYQKQQRDALQLREQLDGAMKTKSELGQRVRDLEQLVSRLREENNVAVRQIVSTKGELTKVGKDEVVAGWL